MKTIFIREFERNSESDILSSLDNNREIFKKFINHSIIRRDGDEYYSQFVGVIVIDDIVFNFYPKYVPTDSQNKKEDFKQVLKVLRKSNKSDESFSYEDEELKDSSFNLLPLMLFFLEDYHENGVYTNMENILEINGNGAINWDRTINGAFPLIKEDKPYYVELHTHRKIDDIYDYFRLLHEFIISECSERLEKADLLYYFDLTPVKLSDKDCDDFGGADFILNMLEKELNVEFNTRKQKLLKSMHAYISNENSFNNENFLTLYGVPKYEVIWEKMCSEVFDNMLETHLVDLKSEGLLNDLDLEKFLKDSNLEELLENPKLKKITLKHLIEKPNWISNEGYDKTADNSYIPDIITISDKNFIILDAKYYNLKFEKKALDKQPILEGQPGIESISKQYLYDQAYRKFIKSVGFKGVRNAFLFPLYDSEISKEDYNKGYVELKMLHDLGLENIQIIMLPAQEIHQRFLNNKKMEISDLELDKYYCPECGCFNKIGKEYCDNCGIKLID